MYKLFKCCLLIIVFSSPFILHAQNSNTQNSDGRNDNVIMLDGKKLKAKQNAEPEAQWIRKNIPNMENVNFGNIRTVLVQYELDLINLPKGGSKQPLINKKIEGLKKILTPEQLEVYKNHLAGNDPQK